MTSPVDVLVQAISDATVLHECRQGRVWYGVDRVGPDQLLDVHRVAVTSVLNRSACPQTTLKSSAVPLEGFPTWPREQLAIPPVRHLAVCYASLAIQPLRRASSPRAPAGVDSGGK